MRLNRAGERVGKVIDGRGKVPEGYTLTTRAIDEFGRHWLYRVGPDGKTMHSGPVLNFSSLADLLRWKTQVEEIREMQGI